MNPQSPYIDANYPYYDVARSHDMSIVSSSPGSYYVQNPMQNNLYASTHYDFSNLQHAYSNHHASAIPEIHMPMNNMMHSVNQYETPNVRNFSGMQQSVSSLYSSAINSQYVSPSQSVPMDRGIGQANTCYLADYPHPSCSTSHVTNFSAPYATGDIHNLAPHLHNGYSQISGDPTGPYDTYPKQLQSFGNTSVPKEIKITRGNPIQD